MADPLQAFGQVLEGWEGKQAGEANARISDAGARTSLLQAASEENKLRREADLMTGAQVAATGASGVTSDGSPTDVIFDSKRNAELDALNARYSGQVKAVGLRNQARIQRQQGTQALAAGIIKGTSTMLKAGASAASGGATGAGGGIS